MSKEYFGCMLVKGDIAKFIADYEVVFFESGLQGSKGFSGTGFLNLSDQSGNGSEHD